MVIHLWTNGETLVIGQCYSALVGIESHTLIVVKASGLSKWLRINNGEGSTAIRDEQIVSCS